MNTIMVILAAIFLVAAVIVGSLTENTWKNCGYTWSLLALGATMFGVALMLY
jgi:hypothetical protein